MQPLVKVQAQPLDRSGGGFSTWLRFAIFFLALCGLAYPIAATR